MGTGMKFKNLLRGLHYISQFLGIEEEEEEEMQIGNPTDVKHVAHIGCDSQSINNSPSWMSEFRSRPPPSDAENASAGAASDPHPGGGSTTRDVAAPPRSSRHVESPSREGSVRGARGHQSSGGADSPLREPSDGSKKGARKHRGGTATGEEHLLAVPKKPHRRKPKGSSSSSAAAASSPRSKEADRSNGSGSGSEEQISDSSKPVAEGGEPKCKMRSQLGVDGRHGS